MAFLNGASSVEPLWEHANANDVVLYMQISHATTLWLLFFGDRRALSVYVDAQVCQFMFGCMSGVFVWRRLLPQGYKCNQYSVSYKFESPRLLRCMTQFWEWKTLPQGLRMQESKASDLWSLPPQKPKYSLIIFKVFQLYLTAGRKGFTEKASGWQWNPCYTVNLKRVEQK